MEATFHNLQRKKLFTFAPLMKFFTIIFSIYLLALSVMPCADMMECKHQSEKSVSPFAANNHEKHSGDSEQCTPFCICNCCGQTCNSEFNSNHIAVFENPVEQNFPVYTSAFVPEVYFNIWQPPKIS